MRAVPTALGVAALVAAADQATKAWALGTLPTEGVDLIPGVLRLRVTENPGAAFSLFTGGGTVLGVVVTLIVVGLLFFLRSAKSRAEAISLGAVLGGAVGNLIDRFLRGPSLLDGKVVDWIEPSFFPTFNLADTCITIGVVVLLVVSLLYERHRSSNPAG